MLVSGIGFHKRQLVLGETGMAFRCIDSACDRQFETAHGVKVHVYRSHKEFGKWRDEWDNLVMSGQTLSRRPRKSGSSVSNESNEPKKQTSESQYIEGMIEALRAAPANALMASDLAQKLLDGRHVNSTSIDSVRNRLSAVVKNNPNRGIIKKERGLYALARSAQAAPKVDQSMPSLTALDESEASADNGGNGVVDLTSMNHILAERNDALTRKNEKNAEAIMALTRIITSLVD